jgi:hypothetical protein
MKYLSIMDLSIGTFSSRKPAKTSTAKSSEKLKDDCNFNYVQFKTLNG